MRRIQPWWMLLLAWLLLACQQQNATPLVLVATPAALDASFQTYTHPSGVFSLRIPPAWIPDELPDENGLRIQFTSVEGEARVVRLSLTVVNTGLPMTPENFVAAVNAYQPPSDVAAIPWTPSSSPAAMSDGSVRLTGIRDYPTLGSRALNIFLQGNGTYFSALEADVTAIGPEAFQTLLAVLNTYQINPNIPLNVGRVQPISNSTATGELRFEQYAHWEDSSGGFNITGNLTNSALDPLEAIRLTAYLYDEQGNLLAEQSDVLAYDVLRPQETTSFRLRFDTGRPSTAARYELHAAARLAEFSLPTFYGADQFSIGQDAVGYNATNQLVIRGAIRNDGTRLAQQVKIIATVFDQTGQVVASENSFIPQENLLPGEATQFEITLVDVGGEAYRYSLMAQAVAQ
jgi:hypothetical protein